MEHIMKTGLYEPLDQPKAIDDGVWIVDGPVVQMALGAGLKVPFPTRMVLIRLAGDAVNFEPSKVGLAWRTIARIGGVLDTDGSTPADLRATFMGRKTEARRCLERILSWAPERVVMTHGRWYERDGVRELERAFRWLR
jgi:hypothetical protein